jgi:putative acetyltransferase
MKIREEQREDQEAVRAVLEAAFGRPDEAELVEHLRASSGGFMSLVAEQNGTICGQVGFSSVTIGGSSEHPVMGIAPLGVHPDHRGHAVGAALVREGLLRCRDQGVEGVVVVGSPDYWVRFGFAPAIELGLETDLNVPRDAFQALEIEQGALLCVEGIVRFDPAFDGL